MKIISGGLATDDRGTLRFVNDFDPSTAGIRRFYQVENHAQGYIRAWHGHKIEAKYVYVNRGAILLYALDLDKLTAFAEEKNILDKMDIAQEIESNISKSKFILTANKPSVLYIPSNYANGFKTLTPDTMVTFYSTVTMEEAKDDDYRFNYDVVPRVWNEDYR